jgi:hypothetical protein
LDGTTVRLPSVQFSNAVWSRGSVHRPWISPVSVSMKKNDFMSSVCAG